MENLSSSLRGTKVNPLGKRRLQSGTNYNYQVDIYMEIDQSLVDKNGGTFEGAVNYVNSVITAANVVYEKEVSLSEVISYVCSSFGDCTNVVPYPSTLTSTLHRLTLTCSSATSSKVPFTTLPHRHPTHSIP